MDKIVVKWTGKRHNLCHGTWKLIIDGKNFSELIPFAHSPADTFGTYRRWRFKDNWEEEWISYTDGLHEVEWIDKNMEWLSKLPAGVNYSDIFLAFSKEDWRRNSCGGCI